MSRDCCRHGYSSKVGGVDRSASDHQVKELQDDDDDDDDKDEEKVRMESLNSDI